MLHCSESWDQPCEPLRSQRSEVRGQKSEVRGQRSEVRGQRAEVRGQRSEVWSQESEVGRNLGLRKTHKFKSVIKNLQSEIIIQGAFMTSLSWHSALQRPCFFQRLQKHPCSGRLSRWWQWAVMSLGCLAGCSTVDNSHETVAAPSGMPHRILAKTKDCVEETWEFARAPFTRQSISCTDTVACPEPVIVEEYPTDDMLPSPDSQSGNPDVSQLKMPGGLNAATVSADLSSKATNRQTTATSNNATTALAQKTPNVRPVSVAPNTLSLADAPQKLPATTATLALRTPASVPAAISPPPAPEPLNTQTVSASRQIPPTDNLPANITWCQVRLRNVSQQTVAQVSVVITSPENTELVVSNAGPVMPIHSNRMDFSAIPQIAPQEEVIVTCGISASDEASHRLHVQVRDAQGGSNQEIQARWKVAIEPIEKP